MDIMFDRATEDDIPQLIRLRLAYVEDDFGPLSENEKSCMEKQLPDYFRRKLGKDLFAFVARDGEKIVSAAFLLIIEMPANPNVPNGFCGELLNVFTRGEYRGKGLATALIKNLIAFAKEKGLCRLDLSATDAGYGLYEKLGFKEKERRYRGRRLTLDTHTGTEGRKR